MRLATNRIQCMASSTRRKMSCERRFGDSNRAAPVDIPVILRWNFLTAICTAVWADHQRKHFVLTRTTRDGPSPVVSECINHSGKADGLTAELQSSLKSTSKRTEGSFSMARQYTCISGDGHIDLNPDIWRDRVQAKYRERAPKRVKMPNGSDAVVIDGGKPNTIGITRSVRVAHTDLAKQVPTFELRRHRIAATISRTSKTASIVILFRRLLCLRQKDDIFIAIVFGLNEFLGKSTWRRHRLVGVMGMPTTGVDDAIKEMAHCAKLGIKGVKPDRYPRQDIHTEDDNPGAAA
jgi:hypothetical protein